MRFFWTIMSILGAGVLLLVLTHDSGSVFGMQSRNFAGLLALGLLATVLSAGIIRRGTPFGEVVRTFAIWILIILALVAGYQYRYELQDVASRITAGLVPGSPLSIGTAENGNLVMLEKAGNGHFEARIEINGATVHTLVDTGATATVLTAQDAARAGYDVDSLSFQIPVMTANGQARAARVTADEIRVGTIVRENLPLLVAEPGRLSQSLLGMNFIGSLHGFDVRGDRMILRD